jgi:hypothetical protein
MAYRRYARRNANASPRSVPLMLLAIPPSTSLRHDVSSKLRLPSSINRPSFACRNLSIVQASLAQYSMLGLSALRYRESIQTHPKYVHL